MKTESECRIQQKLITNSIKALLLVASMSKITRPIDHLLNPCPFLENNNKI